jgi:hypothetical protein
MGWTSRQSWTDGLLPVGLGLGEGLAEGLAEPVPVELGDGEAELEVEGLVLGLAEVLLLALGVAEALFEALGVAVALLLALGVLLGVALLVAFAVALAFALAVALAVAVAVAVALALAVAEALALAEGDGELLDVVALALAVFVDFEVFDLWALDFGALDDENEAASRTRAERPAGTVRAAEVVAGGWPQTLGAAALTSAAALAVLASAAVLPPRRPPMMLEETMAAPATMPNAEDPVRADFMAAPSSPWSSSSRPRVSSD